MSARPTRHVVIIGGGPAGAATARALRVWAPRLADRTVLLEKASGVRNKLCGGGLTGACLAEMEALGLAVRVPAVNIRRAVFRFENVEREFVFQSPSVVIRRDAFDDDLLRQVERDVEVRRGASVTALHRVAGGVYVESGGELIFADAVIGADGVGSLARRFLHEELSIAKDPVIRLFQSDIAKVFSADEADSMIFDFTVLKRGVHGYFWTFPSLCACGPVMNTGVMHLPPYGSGDVKQTLREVLAAYGYPNGDGAFVRGHPELPYARRRAIGGQNVLLVGDAAGIEPLTGEGLAQCFTYARLAGQFLGQRAAGDSADYSGFTRHVARSRVGREMQLAVHLAKRTYGPNWRFWLDLFLRVPQVGELLSLQTQGRDSLVRHMPRLLMTAGWHGLRTAAQSAEAVDNSPDNLHY